MNGLKESPPHNRQRMQRKQKKQQQQQQQQQQRPDTVSRQSITQGVPDPAQVIEWLSGLEHRFNHVFKCLMADPEFHRKYDLTYCEAFDGALMYLFASQPTPVCYVVEMFAAVQDQPAAGVKRVEELTYHWLFEGVIERYTKTRKKPNPVLMETRAAEFCYLLTVKIEAIPVEFARRPIRFLLLRESQILQHIWENYRTEFLANKCNTDQLVGFPVLFEFKNVDSTDFELPHGQNKEFEYYNPSGKLEPIQRVNLVTFGSSTESRSIKSTLSYMSQEKVGPSLSYLMELMMSQGKCFSMSSALKVYDQLISRLIIMHKSAVIHCDITPSAFSFGTGEAVNVLYVNNLETALLTPTSSGPLPCFHDRFVSHLMVKDKCAHFVHDLESAFYVFLYLILGRLPWDSRLAATDNDSSQTMQAGAGMMPPPPNSVRTERSRTVEEKEKFWHSPNQFVWIIKPVELEFKDTVYRNFTSDIVESIYLKVKEAMATCKLISQSVFSKDILLPGSSPYNAYYGVRKVIASYFRYESRSNSLRDPVWTTKTEILLKEDDADRRVAWDMSFWCWNHLEISAKLAAQFGGT